MQCIFISEQTLVISHSSDLQTWAASINVLRHWLWRLWWRSQETCDKKQWIFICPSVLSHHNQTCVLYNVQVSIINVQFVRCIVCSRCRWVVVSILMKRRPEDSGQYSASWRPQFFPVSPARIISRFVSNIVL